MKHLKIKILLKRMTLHKVIKGKNHLHNILCLLIIDMLVCHILTALGPSVILLTFPIHFHIIEVYFYTNTVKPNMSNKCINLVTSVIFFLSCLSAFQHYCFSVISCDIYFYIMWNWMNTVSGIIMCLELFAHPTVFTTLND